MAAFIACLEAFPVFVKCLTALINQLAQLSIQIENHRKVQEMQLALEKSKNTGDTSAIEDLFNKRT